MRQKLFLAAVLLALLPVAAPAADQSAERDIRMFLTSVYSHYKGNNTSFNPLGKVAPKLFTTAIVLLIHETQALAAKKGEIAADGDPFCYCQDYVGLRATIGAISVTGPTDATATVTLNSPDRKAPTTLRYVFRKERGKWLVEDIVADSDKYSFVASLNEDNKALKSEK